MAKKEFKPGIDLNKLQEESERRLAQRKANRSRDVRNHIQREFDIDIVKSYDKSLELCKDEYGEVIPELVDHLESVLSAGPARY